MSVDRKIWNKFFLTFWGFHVTGWNGVMWWSLGTGVAAQLCGLCSFCRDPGYVHHTRLYCHRVHVSLGCQTSMETAASSGVRSWSSHPCSTGRAFSSCHPQHQPWTPLRCGSHLTLELTPKESLDTSALPWGSEAILAVFVHWRPFKPVLS